MGMCKKRYQRESVACLTVRMRGETAARETANTVNEAKHTI